VTAVVHLVWGPMGVEPLRAFLRSYHAHDAGMPHELVILFNGIPHSGAGSGGEASSAAHTRNSHGTVAVPDRNAFLDELRDTPHRLIELERPVQDLPAYALAAQRLEHTRLCFLNSYSTILTAAWLAKLSEGLDRPQTGLVAASGSWASLCSWVKYTLFLPSPYRGLLPPKREAQAQFLAIGAERDGARAHSDGAHTHNDSEHAHNDGEPPSPPRGPSPLDRLRGIFPAVPEQLIRFEDFPAPHLRTNAFMVDRALFTSLRMGRIARKMDAYSLESGRNNLTRQVQRRGLRALVVARDGRTYDQEQWPQSRTFWQGEQEGLLIADNQTRFYSNGSPERRRLLAAFAWGQQADPRPS
jgi:hypothetical protein